MYFQNPIGLLAFIAIPIIIITYLLKQKRKEIKVPYLPLWQKAAASAQANSPWQKLIKNPLMLLQILIAALLALALCRPYIKPSEDFSAYAIVIDASASMSAEDVTPSRLERAKQSACKLIDDAAPNAEFSVIETGGANQTVIARETSKQTAKKAVEGLKAFGVADKTKALSAAGELGEIYVFTDNAEGITDANVTVFGESGENLSITYAQYTDDGKILVRAQNYGKNAADCDVALYCEKGVIDVATVRLEGGEGKDVFFDADGKTASYARLSPDDAFNADNVFYIVKENKKKTDILLVSEGNIFIEKALSAIKNVEVFKRGASNIENLSGYDVYVFDGVTPQKAPTDGNVILINPPAENVFKPQNITVRNTDLTENAKNADINIESAKALTLPTQAIEDITSDGGTLMYHVEDDGVKTVVIGFDLYDSDLPLKPEFPIITYNVINSFTGAYNGDGFAFSGDALNFTPAPTSAKTAIKTPSGKVIENEQSVIAEENGLYVFEETDANGNKSVALTAVNAPTAESDISPKKAVSTGGNKNDAKKAFKRNGASKIPKIIIFVIFILLIAERSAYYRENKL